MSEFADRLGLKGSLGDSASPKFIHVAGTNGKGSVTAMIQSCLIEQGYRTGSFFSPYVVDPRERIQLGREMISKQDLAQIASEIQSTEMGLSETEFGGVTEFEFKAALGFEYWKRTKCDWVALEVGLGGRLDATNIISPMASAIVSISYDHVNILGSTLMEIAREKAGIIKPGKPVVVGEMPDEALWEIEEVARVNKSQIWKVGTDVIYEPTVNGIRITTPLSSTEVSPGLFGEIQNHNAAVAYAALELSGAIKNPKLIPDGFAKAYVPGRFQRVQAGKHQVIFDGAHNADSAEVLAKMLKQAGIQPAICITGMLNGHNSKDFFEPLKSVVEQCFVCPIDFHRSMNPADLHRELTVMGMKSTQFESVKAAIDAAFQIDDAVNILVCGSFYLVGEAMRLLQSR